MAKKIFIMSLGLMAALVSSVLAQEPEEKSDTEIESPSPDGRFAFLATVSREQRTLDLIEKDSGKVLLRAAESEEGSNRLTTEALWAPDSKRVALMISIYRRSADVSVFFQEGDTFREIKLPDLPEAKLPTKLGKGFEHVAVIDWETPVRWLKDGSLEVESETMMDGPGGSATATRTTVVGFDRSGKARIVKSTQKVAIERAD